ncbi:MAG: hypothetical protein J5497_08555, partial [Selenomonadaceae bacterium]|nr:hypothetical protein [Selenomonadaceae bacterium]
LNKQSVTIDNNDYKLALSGTYDKPVTTAAHFEGFAYKSASNTEGYTLANNKITYAAEKSASELFTLSGAKNTTGVTVNGNVVTLTAANLSKQSVTIDNNDYKLALSGDYDKAVTTAAHFDGATYKSASNTEGYTLADNKITYVAANSATNLFTLSGVKNTEGATVSGNAVTLVAKNLNKQNVTIDNSDYTLKLSGSYDKATTTAAHFEGFTYKSSSTSEGYALSKNQKSVVYTPEKSATDLFTLSGIKSTDGITVEGNVVTLTAKNLGTSTVTISEGYTLNLSGVSAPVTTSEHFDGTIYKSSIRTAGYTLADNKKSVSYTSAIKERNLFTLTGVKTTDGIVVDGKTVTLTAKNLGNEDVTISEGYTLKLSGVFAPVTTAAHFDGTTYKSASNTAGYTLENNKITYTAAIKEKNLFTLTGVKTTDGIIVDGKTVTLTAKNLGTSDVTISEGYTLKLSGVEAPKTTAEHFDGFAYKSSSNTAGYTLENNKITYTAEKSATTLFTLSGVKNTNDVTVSGKIVTVSNSSLNKKDVKLTGNSYTLALGKNINQPKTSKSWSWFNKSKKIAEYKQTTSAGYTLAANKKSINYSDTTSRTLAKVKGVKSPSGLSVKSKKITIAESALNKSDIKLTEGNYTLALAKGINPSATTMGWNFKSKTSTATYDKKISAGYKLADDKKSVKYTPSATTPLATVKGVTAKPSIKNKKITVANSIIGKKKKVTISGGGYEFNFTANNNTSITGSSEADKITSNGAKVSIIGGAGDDSIKVLGTATTVVGGKGNDSIVSNSTGENIFVYNSGDGNDVITNFAASDTLSVKSTATYSTIGNDVIFTVGDGSITLTGAAKKTFIYYDKSGKKKYTPKQYTAKKSGVTLLSSYSDKKFDVSTIEGGKNFVTINASAVTYGVEIIGNELANSIVGGKGNDTLEGDKGNDTLKGGNGADVFVYYDGFGNDVISDYAVEDTIYIVSGKINNVKKSGKDVVLTVSGKKTGKITVKNSVTKGITYIDADDFEHDIYKGKQVVKVNGTTVTVGKNYWKNT